MAYTVDNVVCNAVSGVLSMKRFGFAFFFFCLQTLLSVAGLESYAVGVKSTVRPYGGDSFKRYSDNHKTPLKFSDHADFIGEQFLSDANFKSAQFACDADFSFAQFAKTADFSFAQFTNDASFVSAQFTDDASFLSAQFTKNAEFCGTNFAKNTDFSFVKFTNDASFVSVNFVKNVNFEYCVFKKNIVIANTQFDQGVDLRRADLTKADAIFFNHHTFFPNGKLQVNWKQLQGHLQLYFPQYYRGDADRYKVIEIFYEKLRDNYLAQNDKTSADAVMYELAERQAEILKEPWWILYGWTMGWGYKPLRFLLATFLLVALPFAWFWYGRFYHLVVPLVDHAIDEPLRKMLASPDNLETKKRFRVFRFKKFNHHNIAKEIILPARIWHVLFFSTSVLLGVRFRKEWIEKRDRAFLWWVTAEWLIGIGLYVAFVALVKSNEFGYVKGLLGLCDVKVLLWSCLIKQTNCSVS